MENTSGFYKLDGELLYGPNFVFGPHGAYELRKETHTENEYPVDGWHWFDSEEEAKAFFNLVTDKTTEINLI